MNHIVDAHVAYSKTISDLNQDKAELLERIKRLEQELMEVKNKHSVLVADVVLYEDRAERIKQLEEENDAMRADLLLWKDWVEEERGKQ